MQPAGGCSTLGRWSPNARPREDRVPAAALERKLTQGPDPPKM